MTDTAIAQSDANLYAVVTICPKCGKPVTSYWHKDNTGCESRPEYGLIADAVFHAECLPSDAQSDAEPYEEIVKIEPREFVTDVNILGRVREQSDAQRFQVFLNVNLSARLSKLLIRNAANGAAVMAS